MVNGGAGGLVLGPMLRHVDEATATIWVQTAAPGEVEFCAGEARGTARTFTLHGHHYALVELEGLRSGPPIGYTVALDGRPVWPPPEDPMPPPAIRVPGPGAPLRLAFGSCRASAGDSAERSSRLGPDVLRAYAQRLARERDAAWPHALLLLGDQLYADETPPHVRRFLASRRDLSRPPGPELADFTEYAEVYRLTWSEPAIRWLLSTIPSMMIFDDHDIRDDWNTSARWRAQMAAQPWWPARIVGALAAYWVYQHLGNLSPVERAADELYAAVREHPGDAGELVDAFAARADAQPDSARWSFVRDFGVPERVHEQVREQAPEQAATGAGGTRLIVLDTRAARVLTEGSRAMLDPAEFAWFDAHARGDLDHLLVASSLPYLLPLALHEMEGWNEAVARGTWGRTAARFGEQVRQAADLEHWAAFRASFDAAARILVEVAGGRRGRPPATVTLLSGDVHSSYLARVLIPDHLQGRVAPIYQLVCSPLRNQLIRPLRWGNRLVASRPAAAVAAALARCAGVPRSRLRWRLEGRQHFENSLATLELDGCAAQLRWETVDGVTDGDAGLSVLERVTLAEGPPRRGR